jgi:acetyltransferase-like isoleucine patch superfamily enzyme
MTEPTEARPGRWVDGNVPANVVIGSESIITGERAFKRFRSQHAPALIIGSHCTLEDVGFALGEQAKITIGEYCYLSGVQLLCEMEIAIGNYVMIGWNTTIADTDFHPIAPADRIADAVAVSPLGNGRPRPPIIRRPVIIEDDVWIGPNVTILKGVRIGTGAFIEAGTLVTRDVAPRTRLMGNPAHVIGEVE